MIFFWKSEIETTPNVTIVIKQRHSIVGWAKDESFTIISNSYHISTKYFNGESIPWEGKKRLAFGIQIDFDILAHIPFHISCDNAQREAYRQYLLKRW